MHRNTILSDNKNFSINLHNIIITLDFIGLDYKYIFQLKSHIKTISYEITMNYLYELKIKISQEI